MTHTVYQRPVAGQAVTNYVHRDAKTPKFKVKFANIAKPFYYPASNDVPRYSVTCVIDPDLHLEFIQKIINLENKEGVENSLTLKDEIQKAPEGVVTTGKHLMKFQTKDAVPVMIYKTGYAPISTPLTEEIKMGDEVIIVFDILRYSKKNPNGPPTKGLSYQPKFIHLYPCEDVIKTPSVHDYEEQF